MGSSGLEESRRLSALSLNNDLGLNGGRIGTLRLPLRISKWASPGRTARPGATTGAVPAVTGMPPVRPGRYAAVYWNLRLRNAATSAADSRNQS